ncbi:MAG: type II toxin-antitoxin system RelB/DinJ family antitoxin [Planctomycetota bacterium]|jgi:DNA-damage-inducible protein J
MSSKTTTIQVRVDEDLKKQASKILNRMQFSMSGAIKMFLGQIVNQGRIPLEYIEFNEETIKAMDEADRDENMMEFDTVEELMEELNR